MADQTVVHIGENSPEHVAYRLMRDIAHAENIRMQGLSGNSEPAKGWILETYAACLKTVRDPYNYPKQS